MYSTLILRQFFDWLASWSLYLLFALLPVFFVPLPWVTLSESKVLFIVTLLFISIISWIVSSFFGGGMRLPRSFIFLAALFLPFAYGTSIYVSGATPLSIWGSGVEQDTLAAVCIWYVALVAVAMMFSETLIKSIYAIRALFVGTLLLYAVEFIHLLVPSWGAFGGALADQAANAFGTWYEFGIFAGLMLFLSMACLKTPVAKRAWNYVLMVTALLSLALLVMFNVYEVWIALAILSLVSILFDVCAERHWYTLLHLHAWERSFIWIALLIVSLAGIFWGSSIYSHLPVAIQVSMTEVRPSWQGTLQVGTHALSQPARLAFGAGPNTFVQQWSLYKPVEINQTAFWNTDFTNGIGLIPTSLITIGLFGAIAWALLILSILWAGLSLAHSSPRQGASMLIEPLFLGVLYLIAFHIVYVPGPALSVLTFLLLGLCIGYAASLGRIPHAFVTTRGATLATISYLVGVTIFVIVTILSCFSILRVVTAEMLINRSITTFNTSGDFQLSSRYVAEALAFYPQDTRGERAEVELGLLQIQKLSTSSSSEETATQLRRTVEETIQSGLKAVSFDSEDYQNWLELATVYQQLAGANIAGAYENAQNAYAKFIAENPANPLPYFKRAQLELLQKKNTAAIEDLLTAVKLKPDFTAAYYLASQIYASEGNYKEALVPAYSAAQTASGDSVVWYNLGAIAYAAADYTDAARAFERALSIEPHYANALYVLGLSYYRLGRVDDARNTFAQLNTLDPNQTVVMSIIANLNAGKEPFATSTSVTGSTAIKHSAGKRK